MTICKALHSKHDRLYVKRKERKRRLPRIEYCVDAANQGLEKYIDKRKERLITADSNSKNKNQLRTGKRTIIKSRKQNMMENSYLDTSSDN